MQHPPEIDTRQETFQLIADLERHLAALKTLQGHIEELAACEKEIEKLKQLLRAGVRG
jgi:hypothetical protein